MSNNPVLCITMSVAVVAAGALLGPISAAVVAALESLGHERFRSINGGFLEDIVYWTQMKPSDINPAIVKLLKLNIIRRRGIALLEVVLIGKERARLLSGGALF